MTETKHKKKTLFVQGPISPAFIADAISKHSTKTEIGAHDIFLGQVRNDILGGKEVTAIEYTAYEPLAEDEYAALRELIFEKHRITCMHVYHSLGYVAAGEISLFVFTSSPHRKEAMDACREMVDLVKKRLPVWGREITESGEKEWKVNK